MDGMSACDLRMAHGLIRLVERALVSVGGLWRAWIDLVSRFIAR